MLNKNHEVKVYTTLNIGNFHTTHCEDFLIDEEISTDERLIAVLDGCTMGKESAFASILYSKILRKIAKNKFYSELVLKEDITAKRKLKSVLSELFQETKIVKNQLDLEINELLSTLIIGIVNISNGSAEFLTVGDGMIYANGQTIDYEQDDKPDYLGYHLQGDFEDWYQAQQQTLSLSNFDDISICTDGIYTFKNFNNPNKQLTQEEIIQFLLIDKTDSIYPNFLATKIGQLKNEMHHIVTDDLAIIRLFR